MVGALVTVGQTFVLFTQSMQTWAVVREPALGRCCDAARTQPPSGLHDYRHEKEAAHGKEADARPRRIGHRHRDAPEQGQYSDNCYGGPSHLVRAALSGE